MPVTKPTSMIPVGVPYTPPDYDVYNRAPSEGIGTTFTDITGITPDGFTGKAKRLTLINSTTSSILVTVQVTTAVLGRTIPQSTQSSVNILEAVIDAPNSAQGAMREFGTNDDITIPAGFKAQAKSNVASSLNVQIALYYTKGSGM